MFERLTKLLTTILERRPTWLMPYVPDLLALYLEAGLLRVSAAEIQKMRPKRAFLMLRLLCTFIAVVKGYTRLGRDHGREHHDAIEKAGAALKEVYNGSQTAHILAALVSKYLAISDQDLQLWQNDPEEYSQMKDLDHRHDSRDPQPGAILFLLHILMQSPETVLAALQELLQGVKQASPSPETVLLQEACYLAIGEALTKMPHAKRAETMKEWFQAELKTILAMPPRQEENAVEYRALRCRAIWLINMDTAPDVVIKEAMRLLVDNIQHPDVVVALQAVATLSSIFQQIISDLKEMNENEDILGSMIHFVSSRVVTADLQGEAERYETLVQQICSTAESLVNNLWHLQTRVNEIESQIQALHLVSLLLEVIGSRSEAIVDAAVGNLPEIWKRVNAHYGVSNKAAAARLQSTMLELFIDLIVCLEDKLVQYPQVAEASPRLLEQSISTGWDDNPELKETGLDLLSALLMLDPSGFEKFQGLIPTLIELLRSGKYTTAVLKLLTSFVLLAGSNYQAVLTPLLPDILLATSKCISAAYNENLEHTVSGGRGMEAAHLPFGPPDDTFMHHLVNGGSHAKRGPDRERLAELDNSCGMVEVLMLLRVDEQALNSHLRVLAAIACDKGMSSVRGIMVVPGMTDRPLELVQRSLFYHPRPLKDLDCDEECEVVFLERTLLAARRRYIAEIGTSVEAIRKAARQTRHQAAACLCKLGLAGVLSIMKQQAFLPQIMLIVLQGFEDAEQFKKDLHDLELELTTQAVNKDRCRSQIIRLQLQDELSTCDLRELAPEFVKHVLNDHEWISNLTPALLNLLTRLIADNEKNNVPKGEIQDLMAQMGQTSL